MVHFWLCIPWSQTWSHEYPTPCAKQFLAGSKSYMVKAPSQVLYDWTRVKIVAVFKKTSQHSSGYSQRWAERIWNGQYNPSLVPLRSTMPSTKCNLSESPWKSWSTLICEQTSRIHWDELQSPLLQPVPGSELTWIISLLVYSLYWLLSLLPNALTGLDFLLLRWPWFSYLRNLSP